MVLRAVEGTGCRVQKSLGFGVWGLGFGVEGVGLRVWGLGGLGSGLRVLG